MNWIRCLLVACTIAVGVPMSAQAATQTIEGEPSPSPRMLSIFIGDTGELQAKRGVPFVGQPGQSQPVSGMFFGSSSAPAAAFWHLRVKGAPAADVTFGPRDTPVTTVSNGPVAGDWTAASPARVDTLMRIQHNGVDLFEVKQSVLYVASELRYRVVWDVRNVTAQAIPFIFGTSADLFIESDAGEGVFIDGPNRFIGGRNKFSGTVGGLEEVTSSRLPGEADQTPVAAWASYEEGDPFYVTRRLSSEDAFLNTINPVFMDNGVGVSFDDRAASGLAPGQSARYEVVWHLSRPAAAALGAPAAVTSAGPPAPREAVPSPADASTGAANDAAGAAAAVMVGGAAADTAAPVLSALRVSSSASRSAASRQKGAPKVVFGLSEPASVVLRIVRRAAGRRVTVRKLTRSKLSAGVNTARLGVRRLAPGSYVVTARAIDAAGNRGIQRSAAFRISAR